MSEDDILRAIEKLQVLGGGWAVTKARPRPRLAWRCMVHTPREVSPLPGAQVGSQRLVRSVPGQLSTDTNAVLELVQGRGHLSKQQLLEARAPLVYSAVYMSN